MARKLDQPITPRKTGPATGSNISKPKRVPVGKKTTKKKSAKKAPIILLDEKNPKAIVKNKVGAPAKYESREEAKRIHYNQNKARQKDARRSERDITPIPYGAINWERRLATKYDLKLFCETYMQPVFYLGWSKDQLECIERAQRSALEKILYAFAMPRGNGKTAISRATTLWGTLHGHIKFPYIVGSIDGKAKATIKAVKTNLLGNPLLLQDYPEITYPIHRLENRYHLAHGQTYEERPTFIIWGNEVRYPCILYTQEIADFYLEHDKESVIYLENYELWMPRQCGVLIQGSGVDSGDIRGTADAHPLTLEQPRPDYIIIDDVQKDQKTITPESIKKIEDVIDGAIQGMSGPDSTMAGLMPCTVTREGDISDIYLSPEIKPDWHGTRRKLVITWPEGIDDFNITLDTEEGRLWNEYGDIRRRELVKSNSLEGLKSKATKFYHDNREVMDKGFVCSWPERFDKKKELSPQQYAMNLRLKSPEAFPPEYQNIGRKPPGEGEVMISSRQLRSKVTELPKCVAPNTADILVSFIDVQDEILYYGTFACSRDYTGAFIDYGTWPEITVTDYFTRNQANSWGSLTSRYYESYPGEKKSYDKNNRLKAPLDGKLYHALTHCVNHIRTKKYVKENGTPISHRFIGIDCRWGMASDTLKRFIRESRDYTLIPYMGTYVPPTQRQFDEYTRSDGWLFEDQINPNVELVKWYLKPMPDGLFTMFVDVNLMKDFLFNRLSSPVGTSGSVALYKDYPDAHAMFCDQICESEYPEQVATNKIEKNQWIERGKGADNEYLDIAVGCMALAGRAGAFVKITDHDKRPVIRQKRRLSDLYNKRKRNQ